MPTKMCHLSEILLEGMLVLVWVCLKIHRFLGTFPLPPPNTTYVAPLNMISSIGRSSVVYDPWVIPYPLVVDSYGATMPLSSAKLLYAMLQLAGASIDPDLGYLWDVELDQDHCLSLLVQLDPCSSLFGEIIYTSNHVSKRKKKRSRWRK